MFGLRGGKAGKFEWGECCSFLQFLHLSVAWEPTLRLTASRKTLHESIKASHALCPARPECLPKCPCTRAKRAFGSRHHGGHKCSCSKLPLFPTSSPKKPTCDGGCCFKEECPVRQGSVVVRARSKKPTSSITSILKGISTIRAGEWLRNLIFLLSSS